MPKDKNKQERPGLAGTLKKIENKESELAQLYARMDTDKDLYYLKPFKLKDYEGKEFPQVQNVTLNRPLTYAERIINVLTGTRRKWECDGGDRFLDTKSTKIEDALKLIFELADKRLTQIQMPPLFTYHSEQAAIRGWIGTRVLINQTDGGIDPNLLPIDMRNTAWEVGRNGLIWVSYRTNRTPAQIWDEYGYDAGDNSTASVIDYWDNDTEEVYVDNKLIFTQPNTLHYPPFVITPVIAGSFFNDDSGWVRRGESIYSSDRDLYAHYNTIVSIIQTNNFLSLYPPTQMASKEGKTLPREHPNKLGNVTAVESGGGITPIPTININATTRMAQSIIDSSIQQGSLSDIDYGNLTFPLSAVALTNISAPAKMIYSPRIQALGTHYEDTAAMIIRQIEEGGMHADIGKAHKVNISAGDFDGDYDLSYNIQMTLPEEEVANISICNALGTLVSSDYKRRHILQFDNPTEIDDEVKSEEAEALSPTLRLYRRAKSLAAQGKDMEAKILAAEMGLTLEQLMKGQGQPKKVAQPQTQTGGQDIIPLLAGRASSAAAGMKAATPGATSKGEALGMPTGEETNE